MISKEFKEQIRNGVKAPDGSTRALRGTFVKMNCPDAVEVLGLAGLDFVIIDAEHAPSDQLALTHMLRAADCVGLPAIVRVPHSDEVNILKALDMGAAGVQLPGIETVEDAREMAKASKYAPIGSRGLSFSQRSARFGAVDKFEYMKDSNENGVVVVHIENKYMAEHVEELCRIEEIDVLFIGPMDLSQSFGVPGNPGDPAVQAAIDRVIDTAVRCRKPLGIFVGGKEAADRYEKLGARYLVIGSDQSFLLSGAKANI